MTSAATTTTSSTGTPETAIEFTESKLETAGHEGSQIGEAEQHQRNTYRIENACPSSLTAAAAAASVAIHITLCPFFADCVI